MTKAEFLGSLKQALAVSFDGSELSGYTKTVARVLAHALELTLADDEEIRFGIETRSFDTSSGGWEGQLTWLLILRDQLLEFSVVIEKVSETREPGGLKLAHRFIRLDRHIEAKIELQYGGRFVPSLKNVTAALLVDGEEFKINGKRVSAQGVTRLMMAAMLAAKK